MTPLTAAGNRGAFVDWVTQQWVRITGRRVDIEAASWLHGPIAPVFGISEGFFAAWAAMAGLEVRSEGAPRGLIPDFDRLRGPTFDPAAVDPRVRAFYERTSEYELEAWSEWCGVFRPFGRVLALLFSRRLQQLNVPLDPLDTSLGTTSEVLHLVEPATGQVAMAAWVRHLRSSGNVLYAGAYSICSVPARADPCVHVTFPLPTGNAQVILHTSVDSTGAFTVTSSGRRFGDPGFYFTVHRPGGRTWARYVRSMQEAIRVYPDGGERADVRADHTMWIWGHVFLRLHYRLRLKTPNSGA